MEKNPTWILVVALALQDELGRWLMHLRDEKKEHGGLWEFPGGKVESGETPANALIREIHEELGISLEASSLNPAGFAQSEPVHGKIPIVIMLYTVGPWNTKLSGEPQSLEGGGVGWFTPEEVESLDRPPLDVVLARQLFASQIAHTERLVADLGG